MARFTFSSKGNFATAIKDIQNPIAKAATATIKQAATIIKKEGAASIRSAGFSARSSRNLRYDLIPKRGEAIDISARFFFRTGYFNVFEEGANIKGNPLLWLPLPTVPMGDGRRRLTPKEYVQRIGPLFRARGAKPILVGRATRSGVLRATQDVVRLRKRAVRAGIRQTQNVPLYVGVPAVRIGKKFDIKGIVRRVAARIPQLYGENAKKVDKQ